MRKTLACLLIVGAVGIQVYPKIQKGDKDNSQKEVSAKVLFEKAHSTLFELDKEICRAIIKGLDEGSLDSDKDVLEFNKKLAEEARAKSFKKVGEYKQAIMKDGWTKEKEKRVQQDYLGES